MTSYDDLKRFLKIYLDSMVDLTGLPEEERPMQLLEAMESKSPARARESLRVALNDVMAHLAHAPPVDLKRLSDNLAAANAPTIAAVGAMIAKKVVAVLKRGTIANEKEFYLLKEVLDVPGLPDEDRRMIEVMLDQFEYAPREANTHPRG